MIESFDYSGWGYRLEHELIAAVDLGSNSFRMQVGQVRGNQIYELDGLKEPVRLAAGLGQDKQLDGESQLRAITALSKFGERLRGFAPEAVRAVATNALRVAKNGASFLTQAEAALGFPIEVIAGREEARLIYLGVAHTLPNPRLQQLIVDIGGGSTEFIIGRNFKPLQLESLYMGCVSYSLRYFPNGRVDKRSFREAEIAAGNELQTIVQAYKETGWQTAVGSSGTARAIADLLEMNGLSELGITRDGLEKLVEQLQAVGNVNHLRIEGMRSDRTPVLAGGLAIMSAVFKAFDLEHMEFSEGALRLGVLYDLLGRSHHDDLREATVKHFTRRYDVDQAQAQRVEETAMSLLRQIMPNADDPENHDVQFLSWAARLHEVGISIAHSSYHKHSAYILENADMPGFSKRDQARLARIVLGHRGKLERVQPLARDAVEWLLIFCLRTAVVLHRARDSQPLPSLVASVTPKSYQLHAPAEWLNSLPLTAAALEEEARQWAGLGVNFKIKERG
ncbi:MAG TPA: exopolyphosphatase [Rhodocyclaceae bacterium]|nr:exopolyphosphatase [Rhodocyclaceae bacterium]